MKSTVKELLQIEKPSRYAPFEINLPEKNFSENGANILLSYPDSYEVGMSNLGLRILYDIANRIEDVFCDRIFAPFPDMETLYREQKEDFVSIHAKRPLKDFDLIGFSFQYELLYTNFLNILDLGEIPLRAKDRNEDHPIVIGGGPAMFNPCPVEPFLDLVFIGEAEESFKEINEIILENKKNHGSREELIKRLVEVPGVYSPALRKKDDKVKAVIVKDLNEIEGIKDWVVSGQSIVHDRVVLELMRGCPNGCRFCQAGYIYRPMRVRSLENCKKTAEYLLDNTGYEEISLTSLSTGDYPHIRELCEHINEKYYKKRVSISLPSLRINSDTIELLDEVLKVRKSGLTFACEAGSQSTRDAINKKVYRDDLLEKIREVFKKGWKTVKLYFMTGLPFEDENELDEVISLIEDCAFLARKIGGRRAKIVASFSTFIPKPFTPFQWAPMMDLPQIKERTKRLLDNIKSRTVSIKWHDAETSALEGYMARAGHEIADVIEYAFKAGARFDGWTDHFDFRKWEQAFEKSGIKKERYIKEMDVDQKLPWDFLEIGVRKEFLIKELEKAKNRESTNSCDTSKCRVCGACK